MRLTHYISILCLCFLLSCKGKESNTQTETNTSYSFLSDTELKTKTTEELRFIRNEVFARRGYVFKSKELQEYFDKQAWYTPNSNISISFTNKEQTYINEIKSLEKKEKSSVKTNKCLHYYNKNIKNIYPLIGNDNWSLGDFFDKYNEVNNDRLHSITYKEGLFCDGFYIYNINCSTEVENILFTAYCNEQPIFHILSIKGDKILKIVKVVDSSLREGDGSIASGYFDIDFKLDKDNLEVYKIFKIWDQENSTEKNRYKTKEIRREVMKYKLTDIGIVEL